MTANCMYRPKRALWPRAANAHVYDSSVAHPSIELGCGLRQADHTHIVFDGDRRAEWLGQILDVLEDTLRLLRRRRHRDARFRHGPRSIDAAIGGVQADLDELAALIPACCQQHFLVVRLARLLCYGRA